MKQIDDPWNPCFGGVISTPGACWVRKTDGVCFSVVSHTLDHYTLQDGLKRQIQVKTADLPELFRPT